MSRTGFLWVCEFDDFLFDFPLIFSLIFIFSPFMMRMMVHIFPVNRVLINAKKMAEAVLLVRMWGMAVKNEKLVDYDF